MAKELVQMLGNDLSNHAAKLMCRLAATQLDEVFISVAGSQMEGNWKDDTTSMERMEHASKERNERMIMLDGEELASPTKKTKIKWQRWQHK